MADPKKDDDDISYLFPPQVKKSNTPASAMVAPEDDITHLFPKGGEDQTSKDAALRNTKEREMLELYGGLGGLGTGATALTFEKLYGVGKGVKEFLNRPSSSAVEDIVKAAVEMERQKNAAANQPVVPSEVQASPKPVTTAPKYGGEKWVKGLTNVNIPNAQMGKADLDTAKGMQSAVGRFGEPGFTGGTITENGVIISPQTAAEIQPTPSQIFEENARLMREAKQKVARDRVAAEMLANTRAAAQAPRTFASPLTSSGEFVTNLVGDVASKVRPWVAPVARVGLSGLSGALGAVDLNEAIKMYNKHGGLPTGREIAKGIAGAGGVIGMFPFGIPQGIAAVAQLPDAAYQIYDASKKATRPQVERMLTNVDEMGNPL
jgi:hypothetical protein